MNAAPRAIDFANAAATELAAELDRLALERAHAVSFRDLEGDICELSLMAAIADREIEDVLDQLDPGGEGHSRCSFAIGHLRQMIDAFKARYYARFETARPV